MRIGILFYVLLIGTAAFIVGCGTSETPSTATGSPTAKQALEDLVNLLNHVKSENKPPPAKLEDVQPIEPLFQGAYLGLAQGDIVYEWGTTINPAGGDKVLAYEKAAESTSGYVLMQDGTVKTMEASALKAAPKAAK